ncbi:CoA ester lyase [Polaromonas sp.]|uniref:HpcH/HpaI aldolase/citrate lyase family protein n=1 Tax=Polaromonas sp. TaxID=1869339 RepID=UPI001835BCC8|nr:CoA ester lyase [Polaromonas sp.]NMM05116.1 CoA ester lyase [Polaromonas sp.]
MTSPISALAWRSILFVPATSDRFIESAMHQPADALQIDLEDSVAPDQKVLARERLPSIADRFAAAGYDVIVRVNRPWRQQVRDLEASVRPSVIAVTLPKVPDAPAVRAAAEILSELESIAGMAVGHTRIIAMIEEAEGLHNMADIAAAHPRVQGIIVGAEDLAVSLRMAVDDDGLYVPNVMAVAAARRANVMPIGFIGSVADFSDEIQFRTKVQRARRLGFEGAFCIHPKQVPILNEGFAPNLQEVNHAQALLAEFDLQVVEGRVAFAFKGRMVDLPVVEQARLLVARHEAIQRLNQRRH